MLPKAFFAAFMGIGFATVGLSPTDAVKRFTFGSPQLVGGFNTLTVLIGLFAITEILLTSETIKFSTKQEKIEVNMKDVKGFGFSIKEFLAQKWNALVAAVIGIVIGIIPGIGGSTSNLIAYNVIKSRSKYPEKFGTGIPDGVVASETSNNASVGGAMIPLLTLGIPGDGATAVLLGAFMVHGIVPGPLLFKNNASLVFAIFAAMFIGAFLMLIVEFFGLRIFAQVLRVPKYVLLPIVIVFTTVGAFALASRTFDVIAILVFGILGYIFVKFKVPQSPFIIGFILGRMAEENLRRGLILSDNNILDFFSKPIACVFLIATILYLGYMLFGYCKKCKVMKTA
ncbi:tripartite tricarboxylate transporter permease [Fusobacterium ulcerans]|uniref:tripartite tricarboxylate transporter permease n=1 Tax=Fusobacterium ulcerans TaxID=861 RepID=UPI002E783B2F|nr:tripartite tricarboxylate transporter permease [Fusobacterium ulcerans]MEE0138457.1 tripartite tricarboxylate transporter permease [Fusobacterium ulcerans]